MYKYFKMLYIIITILLFSSCEKGKSILIPEMENNKIIMKTTKTIYYWQQANGDKIIPITGELINRSIKTYYSRVGDYYGETDLIFFAENSAGKLEKFDSLNNEWANSNLLGVLFEGSRYIPIEPVKKYSIRATLLIIGNDIEESGTYRLRIDYYNDSTDESEGITPFSDYSNIFQIKS